MTQKTLADQFRDKFVNVENIDGWDYHRYIESPTQHGATDIYVPGVTMYSVYQFKDGSRISIVPSQVGNSVNCN